MPKNNEDPIPEEIKVDRTGTKKLKVAEASDADIKKAPKPTVVSDRSAWTETNKLDFEVSKMAGLSDADAEAKINKKREKLSGLQKSSTNSSGNEGTKAPVRKASGTSNPARSAGPSPIIRSSSGTGRAAAPAASKDTGVSKPAPSKPDPRRRGRVSPPVPVEKSKPPAKGGTPSKGSGRDFVGPKVPTPVSKPKPRVDSSPINFNKAKPSYVVNEENKIKSELRRATTPSPVATSEEDARSARWKAKYEKPMTEQAKAVGKFMSTPLPGAAGNPMKAAFGGKRKGGKKRPSSSGNRTRRGMD